LERVPKIKSEALAANGALIIKGSSYRPVSSQGLYFGIPIPAPLLYLVEVGSVGIERVVGFFVGAVVGPRRSSCSRLFPGMKARALD
jgi:hypothetical protein